MLACIVMFPSFTENIFLSWLCIYLYTNYFFCSHYCESEHSLSYFHLLPVDFVFIFLLRRIYFLYLFFLFQKQTKIWLGEVLHLRFDEDILVADLLGDGELL
jgi:hypothetical protein